jgi:hypothetical protein
MGYEYIFPIWYLLCGFGYSIGRVIGIRYKQKQQGTPFQRWHNVFDIMFIFAAALVWPVSLIHDAVNFVHKQRED